MDWSSVFEDEGEGAGDWIRETSHQCASARTSVLELLSSSGGYTPFICYAFTVNYILGVGCLGIPFAFLQSGIVLGTTLILLLSYISYVTVLWVALVSQQELTLSIYNAKSNPFLLSPLTSLAKRRKHLKRLKQEKKQEQLNEKSALLESKSRLSVTQLYSSISDAVKRGIEKSPSEKLELQESMLTSSDQLAVSKKRRASTQDNDNPDSIYELEVTDLAEEFLGLPGKIAYQSTLMALTYVGLLAYTQVFNDTFTSQVWPTAPRLIPPTIFGLIVIPLSCFDLSEQVTVQVAMALMRFFALGILLVGTIAALIVDWDNAALHQILNHQSSTVDNKSLPQLVQLSGFGVMFTTAIFSQLFQHSVPGLIRPLSQEDKKHVPMIFRNALITTASIYIATGSACVLYFGENLKQSVNLNFVGFQWGLVATNDDNSLAMTLALLSVRLLAMTVVLFPAIDTLSVFPLIAITLGNNLNAAFPTVIEHTKRVFHDDNSKAKRVATIFWRLAAAVPPVLASLQISDLVVSLQVAGLCGIVVAFIIPALLHRKSKYRFALVPASMKTNTNFPDYYSSEIYVFVVLAIAGVAMIITIAQMFH